LGRGTTRIGMYSMQSGYTQGNVYECPRARGSDFLTVISSVATVIPDYMLSRKFFTCP
jgi:hypothetical protein